MIYLFNILFKHAKLTLGLLASLLIFFTFQIPNFQLDASSDSLVLEGDENLAFYQKIQKNYATQDFLIVSYQVDDDLFAPKQLQHLQDLSQNFNELEQIASVTNLLTVPLFRSPPLSLIRLAGNTISLENQNANLALAKQEFATSPIYANNLVSEDGKTTAILLTLKNNAYFQNLREERNQLHLKKAKGALSKKEAIQLKSLEKQVLKNATITAKTQSTTIANIRRIMAKNQDKAHLFLGGLPMITTDIVAYISSDLVLFSLAIIALMGGILALIFKSLRWVIMPLGISISGALIMTGLLAFLNWKVTVISSNFFSLLLVMTLSVMIHLIVRYRELAQTQTDKPNELIKQTLIQMFKPCLFTTLTTFAAFGSLLISGIRPVIDFGWMMSIGVSIALIISFIAFPVILKLLPTLATPKHKTELSITTSLGNFVEKFGNHLLVALLILIIFAGFGISQLSVENRFIDYFKKNTEINQGLTLIDEKLGGTIPLEIIFNDMAEDYWADEDLRKEMHTFHTYLESLPETGKVLSIDTLMQILDTANGGTLNGFLLNIVKSRLPESAKNQILAPYLSEDNNQLRFVVRIKESAPNLKRAKLIQKINTHISQEMGYRNESFRLSGMLVLYNNMLQSLFNSQIKTIAVVFAIIFIMFILIFKSIALSILALIPNTLPSLFVLGIMGWLNIPLDLMTITISAIAIGIGVDNAIHYIHRFQDEFQKDNNYLATMHRSHASVGLAMFYTSITVALGFLILTLSSFIPSIYFGLFTAIAMLSALLANLTLLPKLILIFKPAIALQK
jgi:predicted RND superfamily exporter protein